MNLLVGFYHCVADCFSRKGLRCFLASLLDLAGDKKHTRVAGWFGCSGWLGGYRHVAASWLAGVAEWVACWGGCKVGLLGWLQGWLVGVAARLACWNDCKVGLLGWLNGWLVVVAGWLDRNTGGSYRS